MRPVVDVIEMVPKRTRCVVLQQFPVVVLRRATLIEQVSAWIAIHGPQWRAWFDERTPWRARKAAAAIIERAKA